MAILGSLEGTQGLLSNVGNVSDVATGIINNPGTMINQQLNRLISIVCDKAMSALYQVLPIDSILNVTVGLVNILEQLESGNTSTLGTMAYNFAMAMMTSLGYGQEFALATKVFQLAKNYMENGTEGTFGYEDLTTMLRSTLLDISTKALLIDLNNCAHLGSLPNAVGDLGTRVSALISNLSKIQNPLNSVLSSINGDSDVMDVSTSPDSTEIGGGVQRAMDSAEQALAAVSSSAAATELLDMVTKASNGNDVVHEVKELINFDKSPGQKITQGTVEGTMSSIESAKSLDNGKVTVLSRIMARILPSLAPEIMVQFRERLRRVHPNVLKLILEDELMKDTSDYCGEWFIAPVLDKATLRMDDWVDLPNLFRRSLYLKMDKKVASICANAYRTTNKLFLECVSKEFKSANGKRNSILMATSQDYQLKGDVLFREEHMKKTIGGILTQIKILQTLGARIANINYIVPVVNHAKPNKNIQPIAFNNGFVEFTKTGNVNPRKFHVIDTGGIE